MSILYIEKKKPIPKKEAALTGQPYVSPLFCDMLVVTCRVPHNEEAQLLSAMGQLVDDGYAKRAMPGWLYKRAIDVGIGMDNAGRLRIAAAPINSDHSFLRFEFNPQRASPAAVRSVVDSFMAGGYAQLAAEGVVTRFDATVDVTYANINDLIIWKSHTQRTKQHTNKGHLETYYFGTAESPKYICVYDKRAEMKRHSDSLCPIKIPPYDITRIEVRHLQRTPFKALHALPNLFKGIFVGDFSAASPKSLLHRYFLDSCRYRGAHDALRLAQKQERKELEAFLLKSHAAWWNTSEIWPGLQYLVETLRSPPTAALKFAT